MANSLTNSASSGQSQLAVWIRQSLRQPGSQVKCRLRGNTLHVLYEGNPCPDQQQVIRRVLDALKAPQFTALASRSPQIYQVWLYGRSPDQTNPAWTFRINLDQLDHYVQQFHPATAPSDPAAAPNAAVTQNAPHSEEATSPSSATAIARQLSDMLNRLGVTVNVAVKPLPKSARAKVAHSAVSFPPSLDDATHRLWVSCRASYSPSPALIAEPIARQLRSLNLEGFRDAVLAVQVKGEDQPDWSLRIDLTPTNILLRAWARWGDVAALARLLDQTLQPLGCRIATATLKESALHLVCQPQPGAQLSAQSSQQGTQAALDVTIIKPAVQSLLMDLAPQGVLSATVYGRLDEKQDAPSWVEWMALPASADIERSISPLTLAQHGHLEAIAFSLSRMLNPSLDTHMATGGIRIQLLPKDDLLHIMCDALESPHQDDVCPKVVRLLKQLNLSNTKGIRIYGRRAGLRTPLWSYGTDFVTRRKFVPEPEPEFAATDAYVNELITHTGESPLREDLTPAEIWQRWSRFRRRTVDRMQRSLLKTQLVTLTTDSSHLALPGTINRHGLKTALVWAAVGILSVVQMDWLMGYLAQSRGEETLTTPPAASVASPSQAPAGDPTAPWPDPNWTASGTDSPAGAEEPFTAPPAPTAPEGTPDPSVLSISQTASDAELATLHDSLLETSPYPTFNSNQLDLKLALYYQRLAESGPPDVLIIGSSRALRGVDPVVLEESLASLGISDADVFNFGINGATAQVVELILARILQPDQLPDLVIWADGARAFNGGREDLTYDGIAASEGYSLVEQGSLAIASPAGAAAGTGQAHASGRNLRQRIESFSTSLSENYQVLDEWLSDQLGRVSMAHEQRDRLKAALQDQLTAGLPDSSPEQGSGDTGRPVADELLDHERILGQIDADGFLPLDVRFDPVTYYDTFAQVPGNYDKDYSNFQLTGSQASALESLVQLSDAQDMPIVFVNLPLTDDYLDPYRMAYEEEFRQYMISVDLNHEQFVFRDLSQAWVGQQDTYRFFSDPSHLNRYGAYEVSKRLAEDPMIPWAQTSPSL